MQEPLSNSSIEKVITDSGLVESLCDDPIGSVSARPQTSTLIELSLGAGQLESLGVQLKDYSQGLIDFPSMREGRVVLLCWKADEGDQLEWWHDLESGFGGRQPL